MVISSAATRGLVVFLIASILLCCHSEAWISHSSSSSSSASRNNKNNNNGIVSSISPLSSSSSIAMISSGFSFEDGNQILVSVQKPFGLVLEQDDDGVIVVAEVDANGSAGRAGVEVGDVLAAVQNASVESADLDSVLEFIGNGPKVMNLRLIRAANNDDPHS